MTNLTLKIGWLYPDLMSTYGDRGNVIVLSKRCEWRGINLTIEQISINTNHNVLNTCDLLFMGGAQDTQQEIVVKDLLENKGKSLKELIEQNIPGLYICGAYQFLGKYYKTHEGKELPGLSVFPLYTESRDIRSRLIGNVIATSNVEGLTSEIIGFENHGGRTYLEDKTLAFAKIMTGFGNNGEDNTEGIIYKNSIGTYFHGPLLPKNPEIADWLITSALENKYKKKIKPESLDKTLEDKAREQTKNLRFS